MSDAALNAGFLTDLQQHWPFPSALPQCTLVSARFHQQALRPELFSHYQVPAPNAALKRQAEFLAARICARQALFKQTGQFKLPSQQAQSRIPLWPSQSCGSMSHSHQLCAAIVGARSYWQGLGLDLEKPIPIERAQRLAATVLTADEYRSYQNLNSTKKAEYLTLAFSFKESLFKALNPLSGCYFGFHDAQLLWIEGTAQGVARLRLNKDLSAHWPAGSELEGQFAYLQGSALTLIGIPQTAASLQQSSPTDAIAAYGAVTD